MVPRDAEDRSRERRDTAPRSVVFAATVHGLGDAVGAQLEVLQRLADRHRVALAGEQPLEPVDVGLHLRQHLLGHQLGALLDGLLARVEERLGAVRVRGHS